MISCVWNIEEIIKHPRRWPCSIVEQEHREKLIETSENYLPSNKKTRTGILVIFRESLSCFQYLTSIDCTVGAYSTPDLMIVSDNVENITEV